jgi:uncharacterized protein YndB with AHSA1/START domain
MMNAAKLKVTTPNDREISMSRVFDAPRRIVFEALTKPERVKRWLTGPPGWSMTVCEMDLKVGGSYRFVWTGIGRTLMGIRGVYREIVPSERLVNTEVFDQPWYPGEGLVTNALVEQDGRTTLTLTVRYDSREIRDAVIKSAMEEGVAHTYDNLADLLQLKNQAEKVQ